MKQQEVFKKIGGIINELKEQYEYLESVNDNFNELELELLAANSQFLTDHIEVLRKLNRQLDQTKNTPAPVVIPDVTEDSHTAPSFFEPAVEEGNDNNFYEQSEPDTETPTFEFEVPRREESLNNVATEDTEDQVQAEEDEHTDEPAVIKHELTLDEIGDDWDEDEHTDEPEEEEPAPQVHEPELVTEPEPKHMAAVEEEPEQEPVKPAIEAKQEAVPEPEPEPVEEAQPKEEPIIASRPEPEPVETQITIKEETIVTYNQRILEQLGNTSRMFDHLGAQPVADLKSAISLNDKLLYIKDLFNGYSLAYSEAIDLLNRSNSFEDAEKFLMSSYATKNNWQEKQATADKLFALLRKKFNA